MGRGGEASRCQWLTLNDALVGFVANVSGHQGSEHIKPLHWYVASRLVIEGGFRPDEIRPRPPFEVKKRGKRWFLSYSELCGGGEERTVLGGLKTKNVDVVVTKDGVGPVIAISMKGTLNAFRNLTNRMEEAVGDCTNLHLSYPALVYGFLHVLRANHQSDGAASNDVAVLEGGAIAEGIHRYHDVMSRLTDRSDIRDVATRYEAVAICLVDPRERSRGALLAGFPPEESRLAFDGFFARLYRQYELRYIYAAPSLASSTRRLEWDPDSDVLSDPRIKDYEPRIALE